MRTRFATGPGPTCAVKVTGEMASAVAVSVCTPELVPRVQPPDKAIPDASVNDESLTTEPLFAPVRHLTRAPLMGLLFASSNVTCGGVAITVATTPVYCDAMPAVGVNAVGICGPSPLHAAAAARMAMPVHR